MLSEICQIQKDKPHLSYMQYLDSNQYLQINTYIWRTSEFKKWTMSQDELKWGWENREGVGYKRRGSLWGQGVPARWETWGRSRQKKGLVTRDHLCL